MQDEFSLLVEKWNAQRAKAVAHALLKVLYPLMVKNLRTKLLEEAKDHILQVTLWGERGRREGRKMHHSFSFFPPPELHPEVSQVAGRGAAPRGVLRGGGRGPVHACCRLLLHP